MAISLIPQSAAAAGRNATQTASRGISGVRSLPDFRVTHLDSVVRDDGQALVMAEWNIAGRTLAVLGYRQATHSTPCDARTPPPSNSRSYKWTNILERGALQYISANVL